MQSMTAAAGFRALALAGAILLSGCGAVDLGGLFGSDKGKGGAKSQARDQVPANTIVGVVERDGAGTNANLRVELYEITGRDPAEAVRGEPLVVARTQRDGSFHFNLGPLARAPAGQTRSWLLRTGAAPGEPGPEATIVFASAHARGRLPPLYLWDGAAKVEESEDRLGFRFATLPAAKRLDPPVYGVELASAQGGPALILPQSGAPEASIPRQFLQELAWSFRPVAVLDQAQADGTIYRATYRGTPRTIQGSNPPPLTRQRDVRLVPPGLGFRGLTDGRLENMLPHTMPDGGRVEIDLGSVTDLGQLFLAGLEMAGGGQISVHLSSNPKQIGPALTTVPPAQAFWIKLPPGARGRYLTIGFQGEVTALAEVVAYPPLAAGQWEVAKPVAPFSNKVESTPVN